MYVNRLAAHAALVPPHALQQALALLGSVADVVTGKRSLSEYANAEQSASRLAAGAAVQVARRILVLPVISDTQAGFKGFTAEWAEKVFAKAVVNSFAFDIEVLYLARRMGARIAEMPVSVEFRDESTFDVSRHLPPFIRDIYGIRMNAWRGRYD